MQLIINQYNYWFKQSVISNTFSLVKQTTLLKMAEEITWNFEAWFYGRHGDVRAMNGQLSVQGPLGLILTPAWISNYAHNKVCDPAERGSRGCQIYNVVMTWKEYFHWRRICIFTRRPSNYNGISIEFQIRLKFGALASGLQCRQPITAIFCTRPTMLLLWRVKNLLWSALYVVIKNITNFKWLTNSMEKSLVGRASGE